MSSKTREDKDRSGHAFKAIHDHEVEWESDDVRGLLKLPPGVKVKVLNYDPDDECHRCKDAMPQLGRTERQVLGDSANTLVGEI